MSLFQLPKIVCKKMEKLIKIFVWEGHREGKLKHLANWILVAAHIENGGLSLGGLFSKNKALLAKWEWRFCHEPHGDRQHSWLWPLQLEYLTQGQQLLSLSLDKYFQALENCLATSCLHYGRRETYFFLAQWMERGFNLQTQISSFIFDQNITPLFGLELLGLNRKLLEVWI